MSAQIFFDRNLWPDGCRALEAFNVPGSLIVGFDLANSAAALGAIVSARRQGNPVAIFCAYREPLETLTHNISASIAQTPDPDLRAQQIAASVNNALILDDGKRPSEIAGVPPSVSNVAAFATRLADMVLLSTPSEHARLEKISDKPIQRYALLDAPRAAAEPSGDGVVLFAPTLLRAQLGGYEYGLNLRGVAPQIISAENALEPIRGSIVLLPEWWRGLAARSLALAGFRVMIPRQNGAEVFHSGITTYNVNDLHSIGDALERCWSMGKTASLLQTDGSAAAAFTNNVCGRSTGPLVSVIVRTANRQAFLARAVSSIGRQSYENCEIVLVNNGGDDVLELAKEHAGAKMLRYVSLDQPVDVGAALNHGARAASGEYVSYLDDDDILYPDHIARCVDMLEQSRADIAYTNCVGEYATMNDGVKQILGMQIYAQHPFRLDDLHVGNLATIHSVVHRRSLFDTYGYIDESLPVTEDWELWLRMAAGGARMVWLDRATCEYSWRSDAATPNTSIARLTAFADAYEIITRRYSSATAHRMNTIGQRQRTSIEHQRARADAVRENPASAISFVMHDLLPTAVPVEGLD